MKNNNLPLYLKVSLWILAIGSGLILLVKACLEIGILKDTEEPKDKTASNLFGLLPTNPNGMGNDIPTRPIEHLYKMLEDYTFYINGVPKTTQKYPKDYIFTGSVKQFSWGYGIEDTALSLINHTGGNYGLDFIAVKGSEIDGAIPPAKCVKLTDIEIKAYHDNMPRTF